MTVQHYLDNLNKRYTLGNATEHTFRGDLQQLLESLMPEISATNEPKRQSCGAPDYILMKKDIPVGFIEAKDIGDKDLSGKKKTGHKEQFDRYKASLNNLIFTDYIDFHLYREGAFVTKIAIGEITDKGIKSLPENFSRFENLITDFCSHHGQTIKSSKKLAEMMAGKARLLSDVIGKALTSDEENHENSTLKDQLLAFKQILIHDITPQGFADVYAQTIAYGMFAARLHDPTLPTFSRHEAAELIPKSNPFLRKLFGYIAGVDLDDRIKWIVDSLVDIFLACNVEELLKNYGKATKMEDPIIHFYETFLAEYDPKLRKARGVWYTPAPVMDFIVRAVDDVLKTEFDLPQGLADTSKTTIKVNTDRTDKRSETGYKQVEKEVHKVQILDPATGTGTFLAEVIKHIHKKFQGQQGIWSNYVETHLLPRLNGFELLMASYAMAHLQLDLLLTETGFKPTTNQRLKVYLTNSLEEHHKDTDTLFANWLSTEANEANRIKRDTPVMCVIGNPPYAVSSTNKNNWIQDLISDYKKDLNEKSYNSLSDDYVKFIRYGQHYIEKNGSGILAYISNNSFIDGIVFRQMRKHLLECFDKIYILDLHGNSKKKEACLDGSPDQNVFDIMQGVSVNIFVKTGDKKKNELAEVFSFDLFGKRSSKYDFLNKNELRNLKWKKLKCEAPNYFFVEKDFEGDTQYKEGFSISELFVQNNVGIVTARDAFTLHFSKENIQRTIQDFINQNDEESRAHFNLGKDARDWKVSLARKDILNHFPNNGKFIKSSHRPFDERWTYYTGQSKGFHSYPRYDIMKYMLHDNLALIAPKQAIKGFKHIFLSKNICDKNYTDSAGQFGAGNVFPLYLYPETNGQQTIEQSEERKPNLNPKIVKQIAEKLGLSFVPEKTSPTPPKEGLSRPGYITANSQSYLFVKEMRDSLKNNPTKAEKIIWSYFRNKKTGHKIRRQHIIDSFITDFVCLSKKVVIEIDGKIHLKQKEYDRLRTKRLNELGYEVIRFTNEEVFANPESVRLKVKEKLDNKMDIHVTPTHPREKLYPMDEQDSVSPPEGSGEVFTPLDILDYIYAVLHSPTYREKYKEFLKIDFPRVPYPKDAATFWQLVKLGGEIRQIHLLESPVVEQFITQFPKGGDNVISRKITRTSPGFVPSENGLGQVWINDEQYFDKVPQTAWEFYIGGYQPAQKWLKDRKGRKLEFEDILHYQKIIVALTETDRLMQEIDKVRFME